MRRIGGPFVFGPGFLQNMAAEENAGKRIVIFRGNRIELVIMTACTGHGQAEKSPADDINLVVGDIGQQFLFIGVAAAPVADGQHAGGDNTGDMDAARFFRRDQVAGDLINNELIIGQITVQGVHNPVAVAVRLRHVHDAPGAVDNACIMRIRVANHVQPVPPPALPVMRRIQEPVHHSRKRVRRFIG